MADIPRQEPNGHPGTENLIKGAPPGGHPGAGKPLGHKAITTKLREILTSDNKKRNAEAVAERILDLLLEEKNAGQAIGALKVLLDRVEGPITQKVEIEDVSLLTDEDRAAGVAAIFERARARAAGSVSEGGEEE